MSFFEQHAHYNDEKFDEDREEVINNVYNSGVTKIVNAGYSVESSIQAIDLAEKYSFIYATCGVSPNDIPENKEEIDLQVLDLVTGKVQKGESCTLDYIKEELPKRLDLSVTGEKGDPYTLVT